MRKLDLRDYTVKAMVPDQMNPGRMLNTELPYHVKDSILNLLFIPDLQLNGAELVRQNVLAMKIETCPDEILLEQEEWQRVKKAIDTFKGFGRPDVELVRRVLEAPEVEAEEKPKN